MNTFYRSKAVRKHLLVWCIAIVCAAATALPAARAPNSIPAGTVLPIRLDKSLSSRKSKPGEKVAGRIMQDVPLGSGLSIHSGARIVGHVLDVSSTSNGGNAKISFVFDAVEIRHSSMPVTTNLRALASPLEIDGAQIPVYGGDRGTPSTAYTTTQIGGEVVYRGGGPVARGESAVGKPVPGGVLVTVRLAEGKPCRGIVDGNNQPQALWLFSSDACGVYGYLHVEITHAGRTNPLGQIVLSSTDGRDLNIRAGSGMLVRVDVR
jgi:hypothetical protein